MTDDGCDEPPPLGSGNRGYRKPAGHLFSQPRDTRGEAGKISLFHEEASIPGTHQSVMPRIDPKDLTDTPTGNSIHSIISEAARLALSGKYGSDIPPCSKRVIG